MTRGDRKAASNLGLPSARSSAPYAILSGALVLVQLSMQPSRLQATAPREAPPNLKVLHTLLAATERHLGEEGTGPDLRAAARLQLCEASGTASKLRHASCACAPA